MTVRFVVAAGLVLLACGGNDDEPALPAIDQIDEAVAAVEAELGAPQQLFEVNATPQVVNVFVATDDATTAVPFVYVGGELAPAGEPQGATGPTFTAEALSFDPATVLDAVRAELPDSDIELFSVVGGPGGAVQYAARVRSGGGALDVIVAGDGAIGSVDPVEPPGTVNPP